MFLIYANYNLYRVIGVPGEKMSGNTDWKYSFAQIL